MSNAKSSAMERAAKLRVKEADPKAMSAPVPSRAARSKRVMGLVPR